MKKLRTAAFLLSLLLFIPLITGCANEPVQNPETLETEPGELHDIQQKWISIVQNETQNVGKISMIVHTVKRPEDSQLSLVKEVLIDDTAKISELLALFDTQEVECETVKFHDFSKIDSYYADMMGKGVANLTLIDALGQDTLLLVVYENGTCELYETGLNPDGDPAHMYTCTLHYSDTVYEALKEFYESEKIFLED